ncbi:hypothetical protein ciss_15250 [Carboxydothermus islandicus]|uniref:GGDEF domain-containing protein n=1 Tax=Carboxydothermus islandicus TaxID=661089 RepID=A0A1L8D336_9THEO|nr:diguanylate cyclase [Carboxydothermus islandicus]GAV25592.1 hypothetical protein ciss_15250 [Carboxydothermus islandicus]
MHWSFKFRLFVAVCVVLMLGLGAQGLIKYFEDRQELSNAHVSESYNRYLVVEETLKNEEKRLALATDLLLLNTQGINAFATENRLVLFRELLPFYLKLKQQGITNLAFIKPDGTVFYRFHKKEMFGDNILIRPLIRKALAEKKETYGLELGKTGPYLYFLKPLFGQKGEFLGLIQVGETFANFLQKINLDQEYIYLFFLPLTQDNYLIYQNKQYSGPLSAYGNWIYIGSNNQNFAQYLLKNVSPGELIDSKPKFSKIKGRLFHLISFNRNNLTVVIVHEEVEFLNLSRKIIIEGLTQFMLLALITGVLIFFTVSKSLQPVEEIFLALRDISIKGVLGIKPVKIKAPFEFKGIIEGLNQLITFVQEEYAELSEINHFQTILQQETREENVYNLIINLLKQKFGINEVSILRLNESDDRFEEILTTGMCQCDKKVLYRPELCKVKRTAKPLVKERNGVEFCHYINCNSYFCYPLIIGGKVRGVIQARLPEDKEVNSEKVFRYLALASPVIYNTRLLAQAQKRAIEDQLTGFYNRRFMYGFLEKQLAVAERSGEKLAIIMFDLDHFKEINDNYGHKVGDEVLKALATLVQENIRRQDVPVRYGGDEFTIILPDTDRDGAGELAEKLRKLIMEKTFPGAIGGIKLTASFGIAVYPDDGKSIEELIVAADDYLYRAKKKGRNRVITSP